MTGSAGGSSPVRSYCARSGWSWSRPHPPRPDPALVTDLENIDPESAAVLLVHLAADSLRQERRDDEPRFCFTSESLAMEMIANNLFNDRDDNGDLLGRYRLLWMGYGTRLTKFPPRRPPADMLQEATGISFGQLTTLGFAYWAHIRSCGLGDQVKLNAMIMPEITISQATIGAFLDLFSSTPASLAAALRGCPKPWQMLPIQDQPLLRLGDDVVVLDERYLVERVTRGLYWLVHDYEATAYGDKARNKWSQSYSEMIERRVEDQVRDMAPPLLGGQSGVFTEEDLEAAFPGVRNIDVGVDFGSEVILAEVVAGTVNATIDGHVDEIYRNLLGANSTTSQRLHLQATYLAADTEFWLGTSQGRRRHALYHAGLLAPRRHER